MLRVRFRWLTAVGLACALIGVAVAADDTDPKYALTDPDGKDQDFDLQGEFEGTAKLSKFSTQDFGLQVVAMGGGRFQGQLLLGGLPGDGWNGTARVRLVGERVGRVLTLMGGPYAVKLRGMGRTATMHYQESDLILGTLARVRRSSPTLMAPVGAGGTMLFNGSPEVQFAADGTPLDEDLSAWENPKLTEEGLLLPGVKTKRLYDNFQLHVEFRVPFMPNARGQARGNAGVYLNGRQEIQILDSFGLAGADDEAGAIYKYKAPDLNMALPPLVWQTFDITYKAPIFNARGKKTVNAMITVVHNGVTVQDNVEVDGPTGAGPEEDPYLLPLTLQDHGTPVVFRNVWLSPIAEAAASAQSAPVCCRRGR